MEFIISISRPGKSWKSNMLLENRKAKDKKKLKRTDKSETGFNFSRNRLKHASYGGGGGVSFITFGDLVGVTVNTLTKLNVY